MRTFIPIDNDATLAMGISELRRLQAHLKITGLMEYVFLLVTVFCLMSLALEITDVIPLTVLTKELLLVGSATAPLALLLSSWHHQRYYQSYAESTLRKATDYIILRKRRRSRGQIYEAPIEKKVLRELSRVQRDSIRCSTPLFMPIKKAFVVTSIFSLAVALASTIILIMKYDVL